MKGAARLGHAIMRVKGAGLAAAAFAVFAADPAAAQLRALENPSFEQNNPGGAGGPTYDILPDSQVPGWDTTTNEIELWDSGFNGVPAHDGVVFAEMNANRDGTFYQNICLINGEPVGWTFAHRARTGGPATQTVRFQVASTTGTVRQTLATQASRTNNQVWTVNSGSATYTGPSGLQRVQFNTTDTGSYGNFLDAIQLSLRPFVQLSAASATGPETSGAAAFPSLLVTGSVTTAITVTVTITGGTAVLGSDYTTPGGGASFLVTIPAGTYYNSPIALGLTVIDDTAVEGSETITYAIQPGTGYTPAHTTSCGAAFQSSSTYTITDNDAAITLRKQWVEAAAGDVATLTIARGATVIDSFVSAAASPGALDTDSSPTPVVIGETVSLSETLAAANLRTYQSALACTGTADTALNDGLTIGPGETAIICTYTNTGIAPLIVSKVSSVVADGFSAANPKAIPGARVRYCVLVSNPGVFDATDVSVIDPLPAPLIYVAGSARTGTSCAGAATIEDDDATGSDESDPFGAAFDAGTLSGSAAVLAAGASFAITFDALVN